MPSSIGDRLYELMRRPSEERQKYRVIPPKVSLGMKFEDGFYGGDVINHFHRHLRIVQ